jgi:hypothetical protein
MPMPLDTAPTTFSFGGAGWASGVEGNEAEVAIYGRALTTSQLAAHFHALRPSFPSPSVPVVPGPTADQTVVPGGLWISPGDTFTITGNTLHFAAHAYPAITGDPKIDHVNFTATWIGVGWHVICSETTPSQGDIYACDWNLAGIPPGTQVTVSFDVYDVAENRDLAPNGLHRGLVFPIAPSAAH